MSTTRIVMHPLRGDMSPSLRQKIVMNFEILTESVELLRLLPHRGIGCSDERYMNLLLLFLGCKRFNSCPFEDSHTTPMNSGLYIRTQLKTFRRFFRGFPSLFSRLRELLFLPTERLEESEQLKLRIETLLVKLSQFPRALSDAIHREWSCFVKDRTLLEHPAYLCNFSCSGGVKGEKIKHMDWESLNRGTLDEKPAHQQRKNQFLEAMLAHTSTFWDFHETARRRHQQLCKAILHYFRDKERRELMLQERAKRQRLKALREEDFSAYRKLVQNAKIDRLEQLLKQTDEYLDQIGVRVSQKQKNDNEKVKAEEQAGMQEDPTQSKERQYFKRAHKVEEEILTQPKCLVGGELRKYQIEGLQWLVSLFNNNLNGILADEMGLGKTIQAIALACYLKEQKGVDGPYLIIAPLSTMSNWLKEFEDWAPLLSVVHYRGAKSDRKTLFQSLISKNNYNIVLTSYEYIMIDKLDLGKIQWEYIIVDEGHRIKNRASKLSTTLRTYHSKHRLVLTGTPLQNDLSELWALLNFLLPTIFNSSENFERWFNKPFSYAYKKGSGSHLQNPHNNDGGNTPMALNEEEVLLVISRLHQVLRPFLLRRMKKQVEKYLPSKVERVLRCSMSSLQSRMYRQVVEHGMLLLDPAQNKKRKTSFNNSIMQLQKICNHPYLFRDEWDVDENLIRASGKFSVLDRLLQKMKFTDHRILIFSRMTRAITIMEEFFSLRDWNYLRLDGSTKVDERAELVQKWNAPNSPYFIFVLSTHAGGLGLNLQSADTVVLFDTDWNPQMDLQAQDRAHRIGQKREVRVFRLVTVNSIEEEILQRAMNKLDVEAKVITAGMFNKQSSELQRREMLERLVRKLNVSKDAKEITNDRYCNEIISRNETEFKQFQEFDVQYAHESKRLWQAEHEGASYPGRLITEAELPSWMLEENLSNEETDMSLLYGRGMRQRKKIVVDDNLTDAQWLKTIEESTDNGTRHRASTRLQKRKLREEKKAEEERKAEIQQREKKRKEHRFEETEENRTIRKKLRRSLRKILYRINSFKDPVDGHQCSELFQKVPDKKVYPDYYEIIDQPIALYEISQTKYQSLDDLIDDFELLFKNAMEYNIEGSEVYNDAVTLRELFLSQINKRFIEDRSHHHHRKHKHKHKKDGKEPNHKKQRLDGRKLVAETQLNSNTIKIRFNKT